MANTYVMSRTTVTNEADTSVVALSVGDTLRLSENAGLYAFGSGESNGISATAGAFAYVYGSVVSVSSDGFYGSGGGHRIIISQTGSLFGSSYGVNVQGSGNTISNAGEIGGDIGISTRGDGSNSITNSGYIRSATAAIVSFDAGNIVNSGGIEAVSDGFFAIQMLGESAKITNSGDILGFYGVFSVGALTLINTSTGTITATAVGGFGVQGSSVKDTVTNNGVIAGGINGIAVTLMGGDDIYNGQGGQAIGVVFGSSGNDTLRGGAFVDLFDGGTNDDKLYGGGEADQLTGGAGNDLLDGGTGADTLDGGLGNDKFYVDVAGDIVIEAAGGGADQVIASASYVLKAGVEVETLTSTFGTVAINLTGNEFAQRINGNNGANTLTGLDGADTLYGLSGTDTLSGGFDMDRLYGGLGNDTFLFNTALDAATNRDLIYDFANASGNNDRIALDDAVFASLATQGTLISASFRANATGTAQDADDFILYNTQNGALFYDADGNGAGARVQFAGIVNFAELTGTNALAAGDFLLV